MGDGVRGHAPAASSCKKDQILPSKLLNSFVIVRYVKYISHIIFVLLLFYCANIVKPTREVLKCR